MSASLTQAINDMRTMRESYDALINTSEVFSPELSAGKTALATAITAKGQTTSASDSFATMAEKIDGIQQTTVEVEDTAWYGQQIGAGGVLWDMYAVLAEMKNRFLGAGQYGALIVCEYYRGYDSLVLQGADAYYTCDGDLYDYASPTHVWHDSDNGKLNRWVCFLYQQEGARLDITNTAISPRSMYIGGHIGTIEYFVNGRLTSIVCGLEETDVVDNFITTNYTQEFLNNCILRNIKNFGSKGLGVGSTLNLIIDGLADNIQFTQTYITSAAKYIMVGGAKTVTTNMAYSYFLATSNAEIINIPDLEIINPFYQALALNGTGVKEIHIPSLEQLNGVYGLVNDRMQDLIDLEVGEMTTNLIVNNWFAGNILSDADKKAKLIDNIKNHILARVSDATGGAQLTFVVFTNMYNEISGELIEWQGEEMTLADAFLTKNWLLAGGAA